MTTTEPTDLVHIKCGTPVDTPTRKELRHDVNIGGWTAVGIGVLVVLLGGGVFGLLILALGPFLWLMGALGVAIPDADRRCPKCSTSWNHDDDRKHARPASS